MPILRDVVKFTGKNKDELFTLPRPDEIKEYLDRYIIGQDEAKKTLSVAVYNHYKRINSKESKLLNGVKLEKSNIILLGETGCGKTLLVKTIADLLNVPFYIQDCTKLTSTGYVGGHAEDCLAGLLSNCDDYVAEAETGIVMLDEGDKIAKKNVGSSKKDQSGEGVQQSFLKLLEGAVVDVNVNKPFGDSIQVDTSNILFILSGAFVGLKDIIRKRRGKAKIGFNSANKQENKAENVEQYTTPQDLKSFGLIPEFIGRFPIITNVESLTKDDLVRILVEPENSIIKQYTSLMKLDNVNLTFTIDALDYIATLSSNLGTGARGLRGIIECVMRDVMFEAPKKVAESKNPVTITIDKDYVMEMTAKKFGVDCSQAV